MLGLRLLGSYAEGGYVASVRYVDVDQGCVKLADIVVDQHGTVLPDECGFDLAQEHRIVDSSDEYEISGAMHCCIDGIRGPPMVPRVQARACLTDTDGARIRIGLDAYAGFVWETGACLGEFLEPLPVQDDVRHDRMLAR
jgi:hypothetical protein